ncbi:MAG: CaiB/BaiF CoA transferase family protein [Lautropia sp.]
MALPLAGIRILDLTRYLAGPFGAMILGDLGAEIIRIEHPEDLEFARRAPPHFIQGQSVYFLSLNRNKKSVALDLKSADGLAVFYDLVKTADVVFDNFRFGVTDKLKVDAETLKKIKPDIICCSLSGYGRNGPYADRPGADFIMQGISGVMSLTGEPGSPPQKTGISIVDHLGGLYAAISILASLVQKGRGGGGRSSDVSLLDSMVAVLTYVAAYYLNAGEVPQKVPYSGHPFNVPLQNFEASDGYIVLMAADDRFWPGVCRVIGKPEWGDDPRLKTMAGRGKHKQMILDAMIPAIKAKPVTHWVDAFVAEGVLCDRVNTLPEGMAHPQVLARNMVVEIDHPVSGTFRTVGNPIKLTDEPEVFGSPPLLGQHTDELLAEIGYSNEKIEQLRSSKTIGRRVQASELAAAAGPSS